MSDRPKPPGISRRRVLLGAAASAVGGTALGITRFPQAPVGAAAERDWREPRSANGWPVLGEAPRLPVEGSNVAVALLGGDVATVLLHVARRFSYEIDEFEPVEEHAPAELVGHTTDRTVAADFESNHLSGTAIAVRPVLYPIHVSGGFFPQELIVVRDILADCEGVVRWGGDLEPVKESHFQIDVPPDDAALARVASKVRDWETAPDVGAGATDPLAPGRRPAARALERLQAA